MRRLALRLAYEAILILPSSSRLWHAALPHAGAYAALSVDPVLAQPKWWTWPEVLFIAAIEVIGFAAIFVALAFQTGGF